MYSVYCRVRGGVSCGLHASESERTHRRDLDRTQELKVHSPAVDADFGGVGTQMNSSTDLSLETRRFENGDLVLLPKRASSCQPSNAS